MHAHEFSERRSAVSRIAGTLTWLGGGHWRELGERHERSTHAVAGAVIALGAVLAWLVAGLAVGASAGWPVWAVAALGLVVGLLVGAVIRGTASGPARGWPSTAGRAAVAIAVGTFVGELAALVMFSGSIDHRLDERALRDADSVPAVAAASAALRQDREARVSLDTTVDQARGRLDNALVVARCEYHPTPECPQTRITGVPGHGPETRTANELLADAQRELGNALANRDRQAPALDARIAGDEQALAEARHAVVAGAGRGLGDRWVAMNEVTVASSAALALRLVTIACFALLCLLPLILRLWRGETTHDRHAAARARRERAELEADTAIAIKRAEVRRAAEIMWAEHQLTQARLAIEAQAEIDREQQRRRVVEALEGPVRASAERTFEPVEEDMYLPIAAEAEAASRALAPGAAGHTDAEANLPAQVEPRGPVETHEPQRQHGGPLIPSLPDATKAAARWIRPLVPPFVARVIDNTTAPLRTARQVFEEVEEIAFSLKRTRKVTVDSESSDGGRQRAVESATADSPVEASRIESSRGQGHPGSHGRLGTDVGHPSLAQAPAAHVAGLPSTDRDGRLELMERDGPGELGSPQGPRQLPPAK
ncbi:DUF4407 domain-containing protein [Mycobacterium shinjukuense]|uniref:Membrane protein n=1 Tax=Mycobacterium shinjukuense TaxID=398694 RepID=A0A7I7MMZ9_9MYCO|nr:DUF4407 domain-containing protein [Mycobacterium shinjukuense]MCV6984952.1 DUF4407 domain-containing protein [Mycobacterium shinjukuense]ORB62865.1 hypothetical protein BST45_18335 [Mycobacterium shinjukuense]BBX73506.1 membrane protein [Mycobacterium shinjukuense]